MSDRPVSHQVVRLSAGRHASPEDGACVRALASMLAGECFSDHPRAVDPCLGAFLHSEQAGMRLAACYLSLGDVGHRRALDFVRGLTEPLWSPHETSPDAAGAQTPHHTSA